LNSACEPFEPVATTVVLSQLFTPGSLATNVPDESATVFAVLDPLATSRTFSFG
jgi:hypothetical protein